MIGKLKQKLESLIGKTSRYNGIILINLCILALVSGLMFVQYNWISNEKKVLKTMIKKQKEERKVEKNDLRKASTKLAKKNVIKKKQAGVSDGFSQEKKITKSNLGNSIKNADMYFDYEQYEKAVVAYRRVINSKITIDESDRVLNRLAESYYKLEKYEKAIELYRRVSNDYLNSPYRLSAQLGLGGCLVLTGKYDEARRVLYEIAGQEARYTEEQEKNMVIEAHFKIAESYIEQAKHYYLKEDDDRHSTVVVR
ncbi:MAG: tetratricopeptide repeat protein [Candidatus Scalindua sp.]|nr:tetratricopeptide repeat protein [Candidatus Scalindua sp.]MCR4344741.1 tetratricopeptide repeat protein [Candidatus Scalindua sp.]